jgi:CRISPR-associated protein Csd1
LNPNTTHPAYLCGRVFAVIEAAQRVAVANVRTTIADRYFGAASATPAYVLGKLVRDARQSHFGKLRRQQPAIYHALDQRLIEILEKLGTFPATLTIEEQARFALGYYHQRAADRAAARARRELKELAPDEPTEVPTEEEAHQ